MASNYQEDSDEGNKLYDESCSDFSDSDTDSEASASSGSDTEASAHGSCKNNVCKYYNRGHCQYGDKCRDEHICSYFVKGYCKYGTACRFNHNPQSSAAGQGGRGGQGRGSASQNTYDEECDGPYRWQLNFGIGWQNISNNHILEAQYSLPNTKGITIYNTPAGAISIDFTRMRVLKKTNIKVRRLDAGDTKWLWLYRGDHSWYRYGKKGKNCQIESSDLEKMYQKNRHGSAQFTVDSTQYEISFKGMYQRNVSTNQKRRIRRRPKYQPPQSGGLHGITTQLKNMMSPPTNKTHVWQFKGKSQWYTFQNTGGCSVSSADIEKHFQQRQTTMNFTVNGDNYILDFAKMCQMNQRTNRQRKVRRLKVSQ